MEANLSLFNMPRPRGLFKHFILIEIALKKITLNIKSHYKFSLKTKWS